MGGIASLYPQAPAPVQPINPLQTYGQMLDLRQAQQNYQNSLIQQQSLKAQAQVATQGANENQAVAQENWSDPKYHNEDGSINADAVTKRMSQIAPTTGQERAQQFIKTGNDIISLRDNAQKLDQSTQDRVTRTYLGWANSGQPLSDLMSSKKALVEQASPEERPAIERTIKAANSLTGVGTSTDLSQARGKIQMMARQLTGGTPQQGTLDTGGQTIFTNRDPITGMPMQVGAVNRTISPENQPGQVARRTAAAESAAGGVKLGQQSYAQHLEMKTDLPMVQALHDVIVASAQPGGASRFLATHPDLAHQLGALGLDTSATDVGQKAAARLQALTERGAGTDAARAQIQAGMPDFSKDPKAVVEATESLLNTYKTGAQVSDELRKKGFHSGNTEGAAEAAADIRSKIGNPLKPQGAQAAPAAALQLLKAHPEFKAQFKAKYGYLPNE